MKDKKVVVFDLDDTLIKEIHYLESAYKEIASKVDPNNASLFDKMLVLYYRGENVFKWLTEEYSTAEVSQLLDWYRNHLPTLNLVEGAKELLSYCKEQKWILGLITDGRSITQRNKLKAIGLVDYFDLVIVSEEFGSMKPKFANFEVFNQFEGVKYYIGDNVKKDFITPNKLGWISICVKDDGNNIHKQDFLVEEKLLPQYKVDTLYNVLELIK
ncbi:HAD family hydrolase [Myroides profundi]|uniref:Hydrolase of the HAD superfamily n=1 Tax=Myroides profundi TaxID=480520 RepID=A0AAJ4W743_MYRPR|nr:HAD family hydrolase [Myroides profundi]AJH15299.1 putative hydrolase of the HAD superfamily [Myroides profundi]SER65595.1 putative hydrolase of the HAD superfamily [Myroides profundi]